MEVQCDILPNKKNKEFYKSGQAVTGLIKFNVKPTLFDSIHVTLKGKCELRDHKRNQINFEEYVNTQLNIDTSEAEEADTYEHPFEFYLPEDLPSSYKNRINRTIEIKIEYKIIAAFTKDGSKKVFDKDIQVRGSVKTFSIAPLSFELTENINSTERVDLKIEIDRSFVKPSEEIKLECFINNRTNDEVICRILTKLVVQDTFVIEGGHKKVIKRDWHPSMRPYRGPIKENSAAKLTCIVPRGSVRSIQNCTLFSEEYFVSVRLTLPSLNKVLTAEVPVVIGESYYLT